jgi:hypothetical protein
MVIQRQKISESDSSAAGDGARAAMNCQCNLSPSRSHVPLPDSLLTHDRLASQLIFRSTQIGPAAAREYRGIFLFAREGTGATST